MRYIQPWGGAKVPLQSSVRVWLGGSYYFSKAITTGSSSKCCMSLKSLRRWCRVEAALSTLKFCFDSRWKDKSRNNRAPEVREVWQFDKCAAVFNQTPAKYSESIHSLRKSFQGCSLVFFWCGKKRRSKHHLVSCSKACCHFLFLFSFYWFCSLLKESWLRSGIARLMQRRFEVELGNMDVWGFKLGISIIKLHCKCISYCTVWFFFKVCFFMQLCFAWCDNNSGWNVILPTKACACMFNTFQALMLLRGNVSSVLCWSIWWKPLKLTLLQLDSGLCSWMCIRVIFGL